VSPPARDAPLTRALVDLDEGRVLTELEACKQRGLTAPELLARLQEGMRIVGERFEAGEYFLAELIMSAEIFRRAADALRAVLVRGADGERLGRLVIGTVAGDIHDIGKNIVATVLGCHGFEVIDLGVDVAPGEFVRAVREHEARLVGLSCLLTTGFESMRRTVEAFAEAGARERVSILIGGASVDDQVRAYVGADGFSTNAAVAVRLAQRLAVEAA
jgi:methylmalonyl-CoA mutase cobalamin-binding domain/chain